MQDIENRFLDYILRCERANRYARFLQLTENTDLCYYHQSNLSVKKYSSKEPHHGYKISEHAEDNTINPHALCSNRI